MVDSACRRRAAGSAEWRRRHRRPAGWGRVARDWRARARRCSNLLNWHTALREGLRRGSGFTGQPWPLPGRSGEGVAGARTAPVAAVAVRIRPIVAALHTYSCFKLTPTKRGSQRGRHRELLPRGPSSGSGSGWEGGPDQAGAKPNGPARRGQGRAGPDNLLSLVRPQQRSDCKSPTTQVALR